MALIRIQLRRDTAANWTASNPVLAAGEPGVETDTGRFKLGDGVRNWATLPYSDGPVPSDTAPREVNTAFAGTSKTYARADHSHALPAAITVQSVTASSGLVSGDLRVDGKIIGGTHQHATTDITQFDSKVASLVASTLKAGANVTLTPDTKTGAITVAATVPPASGVTSVAGRTGAITLSTSDIVDLPSRTGNENKVLSTDGTAMQWVTPSVTAGVSSINSLAGGVTIAAGSNVTITQNATTKTITIASTGTTSGTGDVTSINGAIGNLFVKADSPLSVSTSGDTITVKATGFSSVATSGSYADLKNIPTTFAPSSHTHTASSISDFTESVQDVVGGSLVGSNGITVTYNDSSNTITIGTPVLVAGPGVTIDNTVAGQTKISASGSGGSGGGGTLPPPVTPPPSTYLPLEFTQHPASQVVLSGNAVFTVRVTNALNPQYRWQGKGPNSEDFDNLTEGFRFTGVTNNRLSVNDVGPDLNGWQFRCAVSVQNPLRVIYSNAAVLTSSSFRIVTQPSSFQIMSTNGPYRTQSSLRVVVEGGALPYTYQWQSNTGPGGSWANIAGSTSSFIQSIPSKLSTFEDRRVTWYRCVIQDGNMNVLFSSGAQATITAPAPVILVEPASTSVDASGNASMFIEYTGAGSKVQWQLKVRGADSPWIVLRQQPPITTVSSTRFRSTLSIVGLRPDEWGRSYRAVVSNLSGEDTSEEATVGVPAPTILQHPQSVVTQSTTGVSFSVTAGGNFTQTYQWQTRAPGVSTWSNIAGQTSATYAIPAAQVTTGISGSAYRVIVSGGGVSVTSAEATLSVHSAPSVGDASFTLHPQNGVIDGTLSASGGSRTYNLVAASTLLQSTSHYAVVIVRYDDGTVEYRRCGGTQRRSGEFGTAPSWFAAPQPESVAYEASLELRKSAWVSVAVGTGDLNQIVVDGSTITANPWLTADAITANDACTWFANATYEKGITLKKANTTVSKGACGTKTVQWAEVPIGYVESTRARVVYVPPAPGGGVDTARQAIEEALDRVEMKPLATRGLWNPPTSVEFTGAATRDGQSIVAFGLNDYFNSYLLSEDNGETWVTRFLPLRCVAYEAYAVNDVFYLLAERPPAVTGGVQMYWSIYNQLGAYGAATTQASYVFLRSTDRGKSFHEVRATKQWTSYANGRWFHVEPFLVDTMLRSDEIRWMPGWSQPPGNRESYKYQVPGGVSFFTATSIDGPVTETRVSLPDVVHVGQFGDRGLGHFSDERRSAQDWAWKYLYEKYLPYNLFEVAAIGGRPPKVSHAHGRYYCGAFHGTNGTSWSVMPNPPSRVKPAVSVGLTKPLRRGGVPIVEGPYREIAMSYTQVELPDSSQNYVLAYSGDVAPAGSVEFSDLTNGAWGGGIQIGQYVYYKKGQFTNPRTGNTQGSSNSIFGQTDISFNRRDITNIAQEQLLFSRPQWQQWQSERARASTLGGAGSVPTGLQLFSFRYGGTGGTNLDTNKWGVTHWPDIPNMIFLPDRMIYIVNPDGATRVSMRKDMYIPALMTHPAGGVFSSVSALLEYIEWGAAFQADPSRWQYGDSPYT